MRQVLQQKSQLEALLGVQLQEIVSTDSIVALDGGVPQYGTRRSWLTTLRGFVGAWQVS